MEVLVLNGKTYVKASKAARELGYTSDYVGQLCRGGHVDAHLVGRTWFVDQEQLGSHRVEKKRMSRIKAREQAHKSIEEHKKLNLEKTKNNYRNVAIHYEEDRGDLMPAVRKLDVESDRSAVADRLRAQAEAERMEKQEPAYTVENQGEKILMSGKIKVTDVSDEQMDKDVIFLTPKFERKKKLSATASEGIAVAQERYTPKIQELYNDGAKIELNKNNFEKKDFLSKLTDRAVATNPFSQEDTDADSDTEQYEDAAYTEESATYAQSSAVDKRKGIRAYVAILLLCIIAAVGSLMIESSWNYSVDAKGENMSFDTSYSVDAKGTYNRIFEKTK